MPIRRRNPFDEIEQLLDRVGREIEMEPFGATSAPIDLRDDGDAFEATVELPGFDKDDIEVTVNDTALVIEAEHAADEETETGTYVRRERRRASVSRSITLPDAVESDDVEATFSNGVLTVTLPKREASSGGHRIEIE